MTGAEALQAAVYSSGMYLQLENVLNIVEFLLISAIDTLATTFCEVNGLNQCSEPRMAE